MVASRDNELSNFCLLKGLLLWSRNKGRAAAIQPTFLVFLLHAGHFTGSSIETLILTIFLKVLLSPGYPRASQTVLPKIPGTSKQGEQLTFMPLNANFYLASCIYLTQNLHLILEPVLLGFTIKMFIIPLRKTVPLLSYIYYTFPSISSSKYLAIL